MTNEVAARVSGKIRNLIELVSPDLFAALSQFEIRLATPAAGLAAMHDPEHLKHQTFLNSKQAILFDAEKATIVVRRSELDDDSEVILENPGQKSDVPEIAYGDDVKFIAKLLRLKCTSEQKICKDDSSSADDTFYFKGQVSLDVPLTRDMDRQLTAAIGLLSQKAAGK